jgi:hypothetical protein
MCGCPFKTGFPVHFYGRQGGVTPTPQEVLEK